MALTLGFLFLLYSGCQPPRLWPTTLQARAWDGVMWRCCFSFSYIASETADPKDTLMPQHICMTLQLYQPLAFREDTWLCTSGNHGRTNASPSHGPLAVVERGFPAEEAY